MWMAAVNFPKKEIFMTNNIVQLNVITCSIYKTEEKFVYILDF